MIGVALLLGACGQEQGRTPTDQLDVETLEVKLHALMADSCHSDPESQPPHACEKYVTQLGNTANTVAAAARTGYPRLAEPARVMTEQISEYRKSGCPSSNPTSQQVCWDALTKLADALDDVEAELGEG